MQIIQHDRFKWLEEVLLEIEALEFFLQEELISQLPQTVDSVNSHHEVGVGADKAKVFREKFPDPSPDISDSVHIQVGDFD